MFNEEENIERAVHFAEAVLNTTSSAICCPRKYWRNAFKTQRPGYIWHLTDDGDAPYS